MISIDDDAFIVRRPLLIKGLRVAAPTTGSGSFVMVNELFGAGGDGLNFDGPFLDFGRKIRMPGVHKKIFVRSGGSKMMSSFRRTEY